MSTAYSEELVIHVWPGSFNLSSVDVNCLAAVLFLQISFPGRYAIAEETNPDVSPSGEAVKGTTMLQQELSLL